MAETDQVRVFLEKNPAFTTKEFFCMAKKTQENCSERKVFRILQGLQDEGKIVKIGRGYYSVHSAKDIYRFDASKKMIEITEEIKECYPLVGFQVWELFQWNEFVNHQMAHNAFFIEVEHQLETTVFALLVEKYPRVLLNPNIETYSRYRADDMIIVQRLVSGAPAPQKGTNLASLEKLLVDIFSRKLTGQLIERAEYRQIYEDAFDRYKINETGLFRYAGRRHLDRDIRQFINEHTGIQLRMETLG